ncbi:MAG: hypothetical protein UX65_C0016G0002 [Parcubacteria group bacterium GW2011_GWB1_46_8]|nr:MAG: hypothetical protein UX14_C0013G0003 [Parcubacteria group bacterium GW2011_GWF1_45_5]KKU11608.1 MAG: hypothetical protein UX15_C0001G0013 [Parcubacteria group bacterium GW2011_GWA1_45_7]KKU45885.1 MAG: hypothetical protein UX65_C0016G0002 [Parcubacteria group bacterium GW2011_GWB1_46_8]KKU47549.1 MAG: hypothetical protein UX66_C0010G0003 [Parcubacteria group bacterium GW2011_GWF2_46_8]
MIKPLFDKSFSRAGFHIFFSLYRVFFMKAYFCINTLEWSSGLGRKYFTGIMFYEALLEIISTPSV